MIADYYFVSALMTMSQTLRQATAVSVKGHHQQVDQWTWVRSLVHHLWLTKCAFIWRCSASFVQISSTLNLFCLKSFLHGWLV